MTESNGVLLGYALLACGLACTPGAVRCPPDPLAVSNGPAGKDPAVAHWLEHFKDTVGPRWVQAIQRAAVIQDPRGDLFSWKDRRTVLSFRLHRDGTISDVVIRQGSGATYIDDVAVETFRRIGLIAPPPPAALFKDDSESTELPFAFTLCAPPNAKRF